MADEYASLRSRRVIATAAFAVVALLVVWQLAHLLVIAFGAVLVALAFTTLAGRIATATGLGYRFSLLVALLLTVGMGAGFVVLLGSQIAAEIAGLWDRLPDVLGEIEERLDIRRVEEWIVEQGGALFGDGSILREITGFSTFVAGALVNVLLLLVGAVYLAAQPELYRRGLLALFPGRYREAAERAGAGMAHALRHWLVGQLMAMICVGLLSTAGLLLLGVPSAVALGFLAGVLEFVPYVGPVAAALPALALALAESPTTALWVALLYLAIQQAEGALITPLIQRRAVHLPPALTIFGIIAFGILLGPWGVILGAPLTVVCFVLVRQLWVENTASDLGRRGPRRSPSPTAGEIVQR